MAEESLFFKKTFWTLAPPTAYLTLLPLISVGKTKSSKILSWTEDKVLDLGLFCSFLDFLAGFGKILLSAKKMTWWSGNFFSNSIDNLT